MSTWMTFKIDADDVMVPGVDTCIWNRLQNQPGLHHDLSIKKIRAKALLYNSSCTIKAITIWDCVNHEKPNQVRSFRRKIYTFCLYCHSTFHQSSWVTFQIIAGDLKVDGVDTCIFNWLRNQVALDHELSLMEINVKALSWDYCNAINTISVEFCITAMKPNQVCSFKRIILIFCF